jgi:hypothetical protein
MLKFKSRDTASFFNGRGFYFFLLLKIQGVILIKIALNERELYI